MVKNLNSIYELFKQTATKYPKKNAIFTDDGKLNFEQLLTYTNKIASYLQQHIRPGDNVGIYMNNGWQYVVATYAISAVGATFVPINSYLKSKELSYIINDADIKCIFCSESLKDTLLKSIAIHKCNTIIRVGDKYNKKDFMKIIDSDISFRPKNVNLDDNAAIFYTSGTTGQPKGALLSNKNLLSTYNALATHMKMKRNDRVGLYFPMHLSFSLLPLAIVPLCHGSSIVLTSYTSAENLLKTFSLKRVTILFATPIIFAQLVNVPNSLIIDIFSRFKYVVSGGAPLSNDMAEKIQKKFKKSIFLEAYGLVESSTLVTANPIDKVKIGSVGVPMLNYQVKIVDSYDLELPTRVIGEIIVKGDGVMKTYLNSSIDNPCSVYNSWLNTGDLGYLDEDGYLFITGRKQDLIIYNNIHIYPLEIETIIESFDGVLDSAVVAKKDETYNEIPVAFVVPKEGASININNLTTYLEGFLAQSKIPKEFIIIKELPRNASGKVLKKDLREQINMSQSMA